MAEGVVHGDEEPGVAAGLHQRAPRRDRERVRVKGPMEAVRRAGRARDRRRRRADHDVDLLLLGGDSLHRKRDRGRGEVGDHVDAFGVVPAPRDVAGEIWLVLVIGGHQIDLLAEHAAAKILDRHFRGFDRPLAAIVGVDPGLIVENADLDALRRRRRAHEQAICAEGRGRQLNQPYLANHHFLPVPRLARGSHQRRPTGSRLLHSFETDFGARRNAKTRAPRSDTPPTRTLSAGASFC